MGVLQRQYWIGEPAFLGNAWTMTKGGRIATCALFSHQFGCELGLSVDGSLIPSDVFRDPGENEALRA